MGQDGVILNRFIGNIQALGIRGLGFVLVIILATACEAFVRTVEPTPTLVTRNESVRQRPMSAVVRGQVVEGIRTTARVEAVERTELFFKTDGRIQDIHVTQGDVVEKDQVLAELETGRLESDIESAQEALKNTELQLESSRTRAQDERAAAQRAVANAELTFENTQITLTRLLRRASVDQIGTLKIDMASREDDGSVDVQVAEAEATLFRMRNTLRNAERGLAEITAAGTISRAQAMVEARIDLSILRNDLLVANESLRALELGSLSTQASPRDSARTRVDAAVAAVSAAKALLAQSEHVHDLAQDALANVDALAQARASEDLERLKTDITSKKMNLDVLEKKLEETVNKPTPLGLLEVEKKKKTIEKARATLAKLEQTLDETVNKPTPLEVVAAEQTLEKAKLTRDDIVRSGSKASTAARYKADLDYQAAQRAFNESTRAATAVEIASARADVSLAKSDLALLENQLVELQASSSVAEIASARSDVTLAKSELALLKNQLKEMLDGQSETAAIARISQDFKTEAEVEAVKAAAARDADRQRLLDTQITLNALVGEGTVEDAVDRVTAAIEVDQASTLATARARVEAASAKVDQYLRGQSEADAIERHVNQKLAKSLNAIPVAEATLHAAKADLRAQEARFAETAGTPTMAQLRVAINNEQAAKLDYEISVENMARFERGESATDFELQILANNVERSRIALEALLTQSEDTLIRAPFGGQITFVRGRTGSQVSAFGPVMGLANPEALIVEVRVQDDLQTKMSVGQPVSVALDAFPGVKFDGSISAIPRTIVSQTGQTVRIPDATIDVDFDRDGVVMGMLARVNITLQVKDDVMKVPLSALKDLNERTFVETVVNEQRRSLPVVTGIRSDSEVEILSGLEEGQMIFTAP